MPSYEHMQLLAKIKQLDQLPSNAADLREWVTARTHLQFLASNAASDEIILYAAGPYTFIHATVAPDEQLQALTTEELLRWNCDPFSGIASYVYGGGQPAPWIERLKSGHDPLNGKATNLVFIRTFEGWTGDGRTYAEVNQEYTHLAGIHWRPEEGAYCRFNKNGDLEHAVSVTVRNADGITLVTALRDDLDRYLSISRSVLVRRFDFPLLRHSSFSGWPEGEDEQAGSGDFVYAGKYTDTSGYTHGVQTLRPEAATAARHLKNDLFDDDEKQYSEFLIDDLRYKRLIVVSADPAATTNYFEKEEGKPFELSPAYFRPEVLSKYKTDREKYTIGDRDINCRSAWHLRGYDVNEAGQVHAYICDLQKLPYSEQLHWKSFNEKPKGGLSKRAVINDFHGEFVIFQHPREEVMAIAQRWRERAYDWWKLRDEGLLDRANVPLTTSVDEWADAIMDVAKLIVEGFDVKALRRHLTARSIPYEEKDQSISLLEKLMSTGSSPAEGYRLKGLREAQHIRSKVKGHTSGSEAQQAIKAGRTGTDGFRGHFARLCGTIAEEMEAIALRLEAET